MAKFTDEELMLLLRTVTDYRWIGDFKNNELQKMKNKLKYNLKKRNGKNN